MKILKLKMQAFGPFLKEQVIDFNKLNEKGMFLINGPTGTGKTSIFDAIIFALYGQGSGKDRKDSKSLRSDFAKDEDETYVELTFEANNGKEYFIRRSPAYEKKNKKGDGKTTVNPKVELRLPDNTILTKIKEVDQKIIDDILFIDIDQFKHIALLAQGEFTELVTADSKSRAEILEHIFGKEIYSQFQTKLSDKAKQVENEKNVVISSVNTLITKVEGGEEILGYKEALEDPNNIDVFIQNVEALILELSDKAAIKKEESEIAQKEYNDASNKLEILKQNNLAIEKYHKALNTIEVLEKEKELIAKYEVLVKKKREFDGLRPYYDQINNQNKTIENKTKIVKDSEAILKNNAEQEKWLKDNLELYQNSKEAVMKCRETLKILNDINKERKQLIQDKNKVDYLDKMFSTNYNNYLVEEAKFQDIRTRFFASSSYNLAKELEDGKPCPVCGSLEHPNPAVATDPVSEADYKHAEEKLEKQKKNIEQERSTLETSRSALKAKEETLINTLKNNGFDDADSGFIYSDNIEKEIKKKNEEINNLNSFINSYETKEKETANTKNSQIQRQKQALNDIEDAKKMLVIINEKINNAFIVNELIKNENDYKEFLALCSSQPINEKEMSFKIEKHKNDYLSAKTIIENTPKEIIDSQSIDLSDIEEDVKTKKENSRTIANELNLLNNRIRNLSNDVKSIKDACNKCKTTLSKYRSISELARTTNGFNRFKLSFKMYILADYFDKIITQANNRLQIITNGRYHLIRRNELGKGNAQQGLDLDVYDIETGKNRAASTLSGGEKFVTALSMALGLSDIIEEEHALVQVESIFIDEGFGSLDSDYLDMAMKALETIRLDNKTIAIISHVEKLKEYVSDGLVVKKANTGSEIEMVENY